MRSKNIQSKVSRIYKDGISRPRRVLSEKRQVIDSKKTGRIESICPMRPVLLNRSCSTSYYKSFLLLLISDRITIGHTAIIIGFDGFIVCAVLSGSSLILRKRISIFPRIQNHVDLLIIAQ